ncbi:hypothetical protein Clacol_006538 [Clathrus columnatus]|uniref:COX assembly mitochondrial protein n=1 Tax=Clathrus columnatus TaxID=1419009 RepID=A0AAV5AF58_9AGAM|nr:hypothetical protein Clacol_006538 [Clathrus columnatus]
MSPIAFSQLAPLSEGNIPVQWHFMNREWTPTPVCRDFIRALEQCHAEWWGARFFGSCNTAKRELNMCLRNERITRAAKNREVSKERRERTEAAWKQLEVEV